MSNYVTLQIKDELARLPGVGDITIFGARDYSMRLWLNPEQAGGAQHDRRRRGQRGAGAERAGGGGHRRRPAAARRARRRFNTPINAQGRLTEPEQFGEIVVKTGSDGSVTRAERRRPRRTGRRRLQHQHSLSTASPAVGIGRLSAARLQRDRNRQRHLRTRWRSSRSASRRASTTTSPTTPPRFVRDSIRDVVKTLFEAVGLVALVVLVFLQSWRASLVPLLAIPVSLIGTFAVMWRRRILAEQSCRCSAWCWRSASWWMMRSSSSKTSSAGSSEGLSPRDAAYQGDGRSHAGGHRHRVRPDGGVRSGRLHQRHHRAVLPAVRADDLVLDAALGVQLADAQPGAGGAAAQAAWRQAGLAHARPSTSRSAGSSGSSTAASNRLNRGYVASLAHVVRLSPSSCCSSTPAWFV